MQIVVTLYRPGNKDKKKSLYVFNTDVTIDFFPKYFRSTDVGSWIQKACCTSIFYVWPQHLLHGRCWGEGSHESLLMRMLVTVWILHQGFSGGGIWSKHVRCTWEFLCSHCLAPWLAPQQGAEQWKWWTRSTYLSLVLCQKKCSISLEYIFH